MQPALSKPMGVCSLKIDLKRLARSRLLLARRQLAERSVGSRDSARVAGCQKNRATMGVNSPNIAWRRAPFARQLQAFSFSRTSKTQPFARLKWDPYRWCETQLSSAKQLAPSAHETPWCKTAWRTGFRGFRSNGLEKTVQKSARVARRRSMAARRARRLTRELHERFLYAKPLLGPQN
jgi:hypothetical protein